MQYAQLGKSGLLVSRICFGCWQLSPRFWGEVPIAPWRKALDKAVELGVNFVDTAGAYGEGYAEEMLGNYFQDSGNRDHFILATKFYWTFKKPKRHPDTSYAFIIQECEDALRRLKTDRIDLFQVHAWDPLTRPDEVAAALGRLKQEGKVRFFGASNLNADQVALYQRYIDVASLQPLYNLIDREVEARELPYCLREQIGVIPYSPLHRGLLTGKYERDHVFEDDRKNLPLYQGEAFQRMLAGLDDVVALV
ncbi:MAG TPA: aldo/keto reductase, partial [Candidatus Hydrogenedentes bacterium]|nr:aldo/keto reductase [Candidatus Hydrogenedentota bacterium]